MTPLPITSLYAALCGLLLLVLTYRVVQIRGSAKIGIGHGDNSVLERRIRIHANAVENVPMVLILLGLAEAGGLAAWALHAAGATLVVARLLHAQGMTRSAGYSFGRFWGVLLTWLVLLALALTLLIRPLLA
jgi:uncharacterized membrane protein YecN with MAPEG domain